MVPPPPGPVQVLLLPAPCCFLSRAHAPCCPCSPPAVFAACLLPHHSWFVLRGCCRPAAGFPCVPAACLLLRPVWFVGVRQPWLLPPLPAPHSPVCVSRVALPCPLCSLCLLFSARPSAVSLRLVLPPPPFCACPRCAGVVTLVALRFCVLFRAVRGAVYLAVLRRVLLSFVCGVVLPCAALGCRVLRGAPRCCVVQRRLVWRRVCICVVLLRSLLWVWAWRLVAHCVIRVASCCAVLACFHVCCAVLRLLALCCAALRLVDPCLAALLCTVLSAWLCVAFSRSFGSCSVLCCALGCCVFCCVLCCAVPRSCVLCCVSGCGFLVRCVVLFALCFAVVSGPAFLCAVLCLLPLSCAALRLVVPCGAVLLCTVLCAWGCVAVSGAFGCCFVLCPALGCCAVLLGPVPFGASLGCVALCLVRCAVYFAVVLWCVLFFVAVCCAAGALVVSCWVRVSSVHFQKQKTCFPYIFKNRKTVSRWCLTLCTLSSLHATIPHTEKTRLLYLLNS